MIFVYGYHCLKSQAIFRIYEYVLIICSLLREHACHENTVFTNDSYTCQSNMRWLQSPTLSSTQNPLRRVRDTTIDQSGERTDVCPIRIKQQNGVVT